MHLGWNGKHKKRKSLIPGLWNEFDFTFGYCNCIKYEKKLDGFFSLYRKEVEKKTSLSMWDGREPREEYQTARNRICFLCDSHWGEKKSIF